MMDTILELIKNQGFSAGLVIFFVYIGWKRESALYRRLRELENFVQNELLQLITASIEAINNDAIAKGRVAGIMKRLLKSLSEKPCQIPNIKPILENYKTTHPNE